MPAPTLPAHNPNAYAGSSGQSDGAVTVKLFSIGAMVLATFLGSPLAGGIVLGINYRRMGMGDKAVRSFVIGVLATAALITAAFYIPDSWHIPTFVWVLPQLAGMQALAKWLQGDLIEAHKSHGGRPSSMWAAAGIGILCCALTLGVVFGLAYWQSRAATRVLGTPVQVTKNAEFYYGGTATEADARRLEAALVKVGFMNADDGITAAVSKDGEAWTITMIVRDGAWNDAAVIEELKREGGLLIAEGFGPDLKILLRDDQLVEHKVIVVPKP